MHYYLYQLLLHVNTCLCWLFYSLSLHAQLEDSVMCSIIASIWLKNPSNFHLDGYQSLAEMYIVKVLCAFRLWYDIRPFLDSCLGLSESTRDSIVRHVAAFRQEVEANSIEVLESDVNVDAGNNRHAVDSTVGQIHVIDGKYCLCSEHRFMLLVIGILTACCWVCCEPSAYLISYCLVLVAST